jgi:parallel beta-helix repeat protein
MVSVRQFGADPTGSRDAAPAINAALAAANATQARGVYIPSGVYRIDSRISPFANQLIQGDGRGTILSHGPARTDHVIYSASNPNGVTLRSFDIDGNFPSGTRTDIHGILSATCSGWVIQDVRIRNMVGSGFFINDTDDHTLIDCWANNCRSGVEIFKENNRTTVRGGRFWSNDSWGILIDDATASDTLATSRPNFDCVVDGADVRFNSIIGANGGILVSGSSRNTIRNCRVESNGVIASGLLGFGIVLNTGQAFFNIGTNNRVLNNHIQFNVGAAGIRCEGQNTSDIRDNNMTNNNLLNTPMGADECEIDIMPDGAGAGGIGNTCLANTCWNTGSSSARSTKAVGVKTNASISAQFTMLGLCRAFNFTGGRYLNNGVSTVDFNNVAMAAGLIV